MSLVDLLARTEPAAIGQACIHGLVPAVVSSVNDETEQGLVRLRFPWLPGGEGQSQSEGPWARVLSPMAGSKRGMVFRPEEGDEVVVAFLHGDPRFPLVVGALWNGVDAIPEERGADAANDVRLIKSRSGHLIVFDDTEAEEKLVVQDKHGNRIELSSAGVVIRSDSIRVGSAEAKESLVLGDTLLQLFNSHTHPTGVGPSGPPSTPMQPGTHTSARHKTE